MSDHQGISPDRPLGSDAILATLGNRVRRLLLLELARRDQITETDVGSMEGFPDENWGRERVRIELHHWHLPHLEAKGLVHWDRQTGTITRGTQFPDVRGILTLLENNRDELPADWH